MRDTSVPEPNILKHLLPRHPIRGRGCLWQFPADSIIQFHVVLLQQITQRMIELNPRLHIVAPRGNLGRAGLRQISLIL